MDMHTDHFHIRHLFNDFIEFRCIVIVYPKLILFFPGGNIIVGMRINNLKRGY